MHIDYMETLLLIVLCHGCFVDTGKMIDTAIKNEVAEAYSLEMCSYSATRIEEHINQS